MSKTMSSPKESSHKEGRERKPARMVVPLLPLRDVIIFPHMVVPLFGARKSINALEERVTKNRIILGGSKAGVTVSPGERIFSKWERWVYFADSTIPG